MRTMRVDPAILAIALLCISLPAYPQPSAPPSKIKVIKAGRVLDVASGKMLRDQVIVIRDELIESVAAAGAPLPDGAEIVDLSASTVLPGLIDAHTHLIADPTQPPYHGYGVSVPRLALKGAANARVTLLAGVTTVRDVRSEEHTSELQSPI